MAGAGVGGGLSGFNSSFSSSGSSFSGRGGKGGKGGGGGARLGHWPISAFSKDTGREKSERLRDGRAIRFTTYAFVFCHIYLPGFVLDSTV